MRKSKGNVLAVLLVIILTLGCVGVFFAFFKDTIADEKVNERIIEVTEDNGKLSAAQVKSLDNGADIQYNGEIYRLSQTGEENVYGHNDEENIFVRKYIVVNTSDGFYRSLNKVNDEYVTKALLNSALSDYSTDSDVSKAITSALSNYMQSSEVQKLLTDTLQSYVQTSDGKGLVQRFQLERNAQLTFEDNTMYVVQCFDSSTNLAEFTIVGGHKSDNTGKLAFVFTGTTDDYGWQPQLVIYQTGSVIVSNLAKTDSGVKGIKPKDSSCYLLGFKIGGKVF